MYSDLRKPHKRGRSRRTTTTYLSQSDEAKHDSSARKNSTHKAREEEREVSQQRNGPECIRKCDLGLSKGASEMRIRKLTTLVDRLRLAHPMNGPVTSATLLIPAKSPIATTSFVTSVMSPTIFKSIGWFPDRLPARPRISSAQGYDLEMPKRNDVRAEPTSPTMRTLLRPMRSAEVGQMGRGISGLRNARSHTCKAPPTQNCAKLCDSESTLQQARVVASLRWFCSCAQIHDHLSEHYAQIYRKKIESIYPVDILW